MTDFQLDFLSLVLGGILGACGIFWVTRGRLAQALSQNQELMHHQAFLQARAERTDFLERRSDELNALVTQEKEMVARLQAQLDHEKRLMAEKIATFEAAEARLMHTFRSLSSDALSRNNESFLNLAQETLSKFHTHAQEDLKTRRQEVEKVIQPLSETLKKMDDKVLDLEKARVGAYEALKEQVKSLVDSQKDLREETSGLTRALKAPQVRGRWGEMQLKRVAEMAGMLAHCDFVEQSSTTTEEGRLRPDMIVQLPGNRKIIIDAKAPLNSYLEALNATDEPTRERHLRDHARHVKNHITALSSKSYWEQEDFSPTPEFVVLFLPGETFFSAALEQDPTLIEVGAKEKVILATPTTLIALLRAVSYGWRQERLAENARAISDVGRELYKRLATMGTHMMRLGKSLNGAVDSYNSTLSILEKRVMVSARRFEEMGVTGSGETLLESLPLDKLARAPEETLEEPLPDLLPLSKGAA